MQFCPSVAIHKILQSYGERHGLSRADVWTFNESDGIASFYCGWRSGNGVIVTDDEQNKDILAQVRSASEVVSDTTTHTGYFTALTSRDSALVGVLHTEVPKVSTLSEPH